MDKFYRTTLLSGEDRREPAFYELLKIIKDKYDIDLSEYKETPLIRKMGVRLRLCRCLTFDRYLRYLESNPEEFDELLDSLTINVTTFFRNPQTYKIIKDEVIPLIYQYRQKSPIKMVRFWSIGCSSGEEPYSLAMMSRELAEGPLKNLQVMIYATDVDDKVIKSAQSGLFPRMKLSKLSEPLRQKYFVEKELKIYKIKDEVRKMVLFKKHNLIQDPPYRRIDLILFRNVMIYFSSQLQEKILRELYDCLNPGGFLVLGKVESPPGELRDLFHPFNLKEKMYRKPLEETP